jgi:hypothetical protein
VLKRLARHTRWTFHFTPTSASWLNAVEGFFAKLTKRRLKRGVFVSVVDLQDAINAPSSNTTHIRTKPFTWTADPDKIIRASETGTKCSLSIKVQYSNQDTMLSGPHSKAIRRFAIQSN